MGIFSQAGFAVGVLTAALAAGAAEVLACACASKGNVRKQETMLKIASRFMASSLLAADRMAARQDARLAAVWMAVRIQWKPWCDCRGRRSLQPHGGCRPS